jgi:Fe-S oxidoreductase
VVGEKSEAALLDALGIDYRILRAGCCGMAGSFGFEKEHYEVSIAAGERALLPAVRAAATDTLVVADGYSCRERIAQCTGRQAIHPAELVARSLARSLKFRDHGTAH